MHSSQTTETKLKFLVIRRDNIGDLVCTTPLIRALRAKFPNAYLAAFVNSYNQAVLENNPDLDAIFSYTKAKHRGAGQSILGVHLDRLRLLIRLRRIRFDYVILAAPGFQRRTLPLARFLRPRHILGYVDPDSPAGAIDMATPYHFGPMHHEVEETFWLLRHLDIDESPPSVRVYPADGEEAGARAALNRNGWRDNAPLIGLHISARKPSQRWPAERFIDLARELHAKRGSRFLLFWSPGEASNPLHPGDDAKAREIIEKTSGLPVLPYPTARLSQLIGGLALCDAVICADGGAMHLAAGLGKPILCFFGKSDPTRWRPWGVPYRLLQKPSLDVADISVNEAVEEFGRLMDSSCS